MLCVYLNCVYFNICYLCFYNPGQNIWKKLKPKAELKKIRKTFLLLYCCCSDCCCQKFISGGGTGQYGVSSLNFDVFLIFCNFRRSDVLICSGTQEATCTPSLLYWISSPVLLVMNWTSTKTVNCESIIIRIVRKMFIFLLHP